MSARPLAVSVAPHALAYDEHSPQANIQQVENLRRGSYGLVNSDRPGATGNVSAQQPEWSTEIASKMVTLSVEHF